MDESARIRHEACPGRRQQERLGGPIIGQLEKLSDRLNAGVHGVHDVIAANIIGKPRTDKRFSDMVTWNGGKIGGGAFFGFFERSP